MKGPARSPVWAVLTTLFFSAVVSAQSENICPVVALMPKPKNYICGREGVITTPQMISAANVTDSDTCRDTCLGTQGCVSFSYGPGEACLLYKARIRNSGFKKSPSSINFYNRHCFACNCDEGSAPCSGKFGPCVDMQTDNNNCGACGNVCPANTACTGGTCACQLSESITNGGFESGSLSPWSFTPMRNNLGEERTAISIDDTAGDSSEGTYYADIYHKKSSDPPELAFNLTQPVSLCPNTEYTFTYSSTSSCPGGKCPCGIKACVSGFCGHNVHPPQTGEYSPSSFTFNSGDLTSGTVRVFVDRFDQRTCLRNYLYLDGFSLTPTSDSG